MTRAEEAAQADACQTEEGPTTIHFLLKKPDPLWDFTLCGKKAYRRSRIPNEVLRKRPRRMCERCDELKRVDTALDALAVNMGVER